MVAVQMPQEDAMGEPREPQLFAQILQQMPGGSPPDAFDFTTEGSAAEGTPYLSFQFETVFITKIDYSGGGTWLAEDHVEPSDPSAGLFPTETIRPTESLFDL
jgi:hypothetical protein